MNTNTIIFLFIHFNSIILEKENTDFWREKKITWEILHEIISNLEKS